MIGKPLIRKHRLAARLALYSSPLVLVGLAWGFIRLAGNLGLDMSWSGVDHSELESVRLFQEYLRIDTSYPEGNEILGAEFLARQLEAAGIEAHVERLGERNANLWAVLEGAQHQALVLHHHIDVEPVRNLEGWRHPPFSGALDPPFVYGRGAFDMKSIGIAQLMVTLELQRSGKPLERSLIFLATGDEERDSRMGTQRLLREHPQLAARFGTVLTEGGAVEAVAVSAAKYWGTDFFQKRFVDVWVCDSSRSRLEDLRTEVHGRAGRPRLPSPPVAAFFERYSASRDNPSFRRLLRRPEVMVRDFDFLFLPENVKSMLRDEVVAFPVEPDPEGGFQVRLILHLLPDSDFEDAFARLLADSLVGFSYSVDEQHGKVGPSPLGHPVFQTIEELMAEAVPEVDHGPLFLPWTATDARFFRGLGIPTYGFSPFWIVSGDAMKMKGQNERMPTPPFVEGVELYRRLVERLVLGSGAG